MSDLDREGHNPYFDIDGHRYYISSHAVQRAYEMEVPLPLVPHIIKQGERRENPGRSKYATAGSYYIAAGKVALAIAPDKDGSSAVVTLVWTTDEAWNEWFQKRGEKFGGRTFRGADYLKQIASINDKGVTK